MRQWVITVLSAGLALAGCAARNGNMEFSGGVAAEQMSADVFRIKSSGNVRTEDVLLIAAETTKGAGATHFKLISANDASPQVDFTTPGSVTPSVGGRPADSSNPSATTSATIKPGRDAYIRVLRLAPGQQPPGGAFAVDEIMQFVGRRGKRG